MSLPSESWEIFSGVSTVALSVVFSVKSMGTSPRIVSLPASAASFSVSPALFSWNDNGASSAASWSHSGRRASDTNSCSRPTRPCSGSASSPGRRCCQRDRAAR